MIKVILAENTIPLSKIQESIPIFAKRDGDLKGMLVLEHKEWILRTGGKNGATGHYTTREACIKSCLDLNYEFFIV